MNLTASSQVTVVPSEHALGRHTTREVANREGRSIRGNLPDFLIAHAFLKDSFQNLGLLDVEIAGIACAAAPDGSGIGRTRSSKS